MLQTMWKKILSLFNKENLSDDTENRDNERYTSSYEDNKDINFTAIFSNKLSNYVINETNFDLVGDDKRSKILQDVIKRISKKLKKVISRSLGTGGCLVVPYVNSGKIYFDVITQDRLLINKRLGEDIIDCTLMAEHIVRNQKNYYRWADYTLENGNLYIRYRATLESTPIELNAIEEWCNIKDIAITNVDKMPFMFLKSPIDNRQDNDTYGVPITYGCDKQIREIKETLNQIIKEYGLKETFVGADSTMFNGEGALPKNGLFKKINAGEDTFFEIFSPEIRDTSLYNKLMNQCAMLEKQIGTSRGILTEPLSSYQNVDETRRALYDTFSIVDDIRTSMAEELDNFIKACEVLCNYYVLSPQGKYKLKIDWGYSFTEDSTTQWNQLLQGESRGVIKKAELRQYIKPEETLEEAQAVIDEIEANEPNLDKLLNNDINSNKDKKSKLETAKNKEKEDNKQDKK